MTLFTYLGFKEVLTMRFWWGKSPQFAIFSKRKKWFTSMLEEICPLDPVIPELSNEEQSWTFVSLSEMCLL